MNNILISYKGVVLRQKDLDTLGDGCWVNDNIINFFVNWNDKRENVGMIEPAAILLMSSEDDETIKDMMCELKMETKDYLVLPMNDIQGRLGSGSHWSLLVYCKAENKFVYYDSASPSGNMLINLDKV